MTNITNQTIENYLLGKLSISEKEAFEKAMKTNPTLKKEVQLQKDILGAVENMGDLLLLRRIETMSKEMDNERTIVPPLTKKAPARRRFLYLVSSAAAVLLLVVAYFSFFQVSPNERLFEQHFVAYELETLRSAGTDEERLFQQGAIAYEQKKYAAALIHFEKIIANNPEARMAAGICYLQTEQLDKALEQFQGLAPTTYKYQAQWYAALTSLKGDDMDNSKRLFRQLANSKNPYTEQAKTILQNLEK